jgi:RNA polymerase sigma-70 factor (sigma-E family)
MVVRTDGESVAAIYGSDGEPVPELVGPDPSAARRAAAGLVPDAAALHREHFLHLTRLAAMLVGDRETAEDIVQDVFVRMQGRWRRFPDTERALRYVRASVVNGARAALRRRRLAARTAAQHGSDTDPTGPAAEQLVLDGLRDGSVRAAVARLPRRQREVILLRYLEDLSIVETARVLGISGGAVKASAGRAMISLASMLGADRDEC